MRDDGGDLFRRGLLLAGGCAALAGVLLVRSDTASHYPVWLPWLWMVLALPLAATAIESGYFHVDLSLVGASLACSLIGLITYLVGQSGAGGADHMLNLGPLFALVGFGVGVICSGIVLKEYVGEFFERPQDDADLDIPTHDPVPTGPTKPCPKCGQSVPTYAAACRFCKTILVE